MPSVLRIIIHALYEDTSKIPYRVFIPLYVGAITLFVFGTLQEAFLYLFTSAINHQHSQFFQHVTNFEDFFYRRIYLRARDCFERPLKSSPGRYVDVIEREISKDKQEVSLSRRVQDCLNLGSYNYLGFVPDKKEDITKDMAVCLAKYPPGLSMTIGEGGYTTLHKELEEKLAVFLGREDVLVFGVGYETNSTTIPVLGDKHTLYLSDALNHTSIITGTKRASGTCRIFKHNDMSDLRAHLEQAHTETEQWSRVLIIVEGLYSMEGDICPLADIVRLKKEFSQDNQPVHIYLDEAHSIGAIGPTGRGVSELLGVSPTDIDIMMGTFSKSFASVGGYVAGNHAVIEYVRAHSAGVIHMAAMSPLCVQQVITCLDEIMQESGQRRIRQLQENVQYFRQRVKNIGFRVLGDDRSPVVPIMVYIAASLTEFSRFCYEENIAVVIVSYPATSLGMGRARVCLSAAHTREDLDRALDVIKRAGEHLQMHILQ